MTSDAQVVVVSKKKKDTPVKVTFIGYDKPLHQKCGKPTTLNWSIKITAVHNLRMGNLLNILNIPISLAMIYLHLRFLTSHWGWFMVHGDVSHREVSLGNELLRS